MTFISWINKVILMSLVVIFTVITTNVQSQEDSFAKKPKKVKSKSSNDHFAIRGKTKRENKQKRGSSNRKNSVLKSEKPVISKDKFALKIFKSTRDKTKNTGFSKEEVGFRMTWLGSAFSKELKKVDKKQKTEDSFSADNRGVQLGFPKDEFSTKVKKVKKIKDNNFSASNQGGQLRTDDAFSSKLKKGPKIKSGGDGLGDGFSNKVNKGIFITDQDAFSTKLKSVSQDVNGDSFTRRTKKTKIKKGTDGLGDAFAVKLKTPGMDVSADAFGRKVKKRRKQEKLGDAFAQKPIKVGLGYTEDSFATKVTKSKKPRKGDGLDDAFTVPLITGFIDVDQDAFSTKIKGPKLKGKKGQKGWLSDSFSSELRSVDFLVDADAFTTSNPLRNWWIKRKSKAFKRKLFSKGSNKNKAKSTDGDAFTTGPKQKKKQQAKRTGNPQMDLFQKGVLPK